jgi:3-keto-L-gulonate-6-phosphate decarboxylase
VEISRARVVYADSIPEAERRKMPESSITAGAELRVTADLDDRGEWRASRIEILSLHTSYDIPAASERLPWNRS